MQNVVNELNAMGIEAEVVIVEKNGVKKEGVCVKVGGNVCPVFYDLTAEEIADAIRKMDIPEFDVDNLASKKYILANAFPCVAKKANDNAMSMNIADLDMYWRVRVNDNATFVLTKKMVEEYGITFTELLDIKGKYTVESLFKKIRSMLGDFDFEESENETQYVAGNEDGVYGAGVITSTGIMLDFAKDHNVNGFFVLPSSIHEVLFVLGDEEQEFLDNMVRSVNEEQVAPVDRLSDHSYWFDATKAELRCRK